MSSRARQVSPVLLLVPILALMVGADAYPDAVRRAVHVLAGERRVAAVVPRSTVPDAGAVNAPRFAPPPEVATAPVFVGEFRLPGVVAPQLARPAWTAPSLMVPVGALASVTPVGAPCHLPGDSRCAGSVVAGLGVALDTNSHWRFGTDLVVRAEGWDARYRPEVVSPFLIPSAEYLVNPGSAAPVSVGIQAPISLGDTVPGGGVFFFVRWDELWGKPARRR